MPIYNAQSIRQLPPECMHDPETVQAIVQQIVLLEGAHNRRHALSALVDQLLAAGEFEAAASAARLAPDLTPANLVNNVDYWLKGALLIKVVDALLERQEQARAVQLLDEATLELDQLARYEPSDLPVEPPWFQLTSRYRHIGLPVRVSHIWERVVAWAQSVEQSPAIPDPAWFQPEDGSRFIMDIVKEMLEQGERERAYITGAAIQHEPYRAKALALLLQAGAPGGSPRLHRDGAESGAVSLEPGTRRESAHIDVAATVAVIGQLLERSQGINVERTADLALAGELLGSVGIARIRGAGMAAGALWEQARRELVALLAGFDGPGAGDVPPGERVRAGQALGLLGDPRIPLSDDEWRASLVALATTLTAEGAHYWRYVPGGHYWIGGWAEYDPYAGPMQRDQWIEQLPVAAFWLARMPVTVAQFARFVASGYQENDHWTPAGLQWRSEQAPAVRPGAAQDRGPNQPIGHVTWYEAMAYCRWLSAQLEAALPAGYCVRLPSEAEWEVAACYDGTARRRLHPWGDQALTTGRAVTAAWQRSTPAPVGLCPGGMAACGALDMVGDDTGEWSGSAEESYPKRANILVDDHPMPGSIAPLSVPVRGLLSGRATSSAPSCGARSASWPNRSVSSSGFRLVLAPRQG